MSSGFCFGLGLSLVFLRFLVSNWNCFSIFLSLILLSASFSFASFSRGASASLAFQAPCSTASNNFYCTCSYDIDGGRIIYVQSSWFQNKSYFAIYCRTGHPSRVNITSVFLHRCWLDAPIDMPVPMKILFQSQHVTKRRTRGAV